MTRQRNRQCDDITGIMKNEKFLSFLYGLDHTKIDFGLTSIEKLLQRMGDPHRRYHTIHVGGTNGKGSVCAMVAEMFQNAGYRVGVYTSPHLVDFEERIRVDGASITAEEREDLGRDIMRHMPTDITFFECATALAFYAFARREVDIAVVEVGMGGRLDATNVVRPIVSIITTIAREHQIYLGRTIREITAEKGGIIKVGGVCVTGVRNMTARERLQDICFERHARLLLCGRDFHVRRRRDGRLSYRGLSLSLSNVTLNLPGAHQARNAALALAAAEVCREHGLPIDETSFRHGLERVTWPGRCEVIDRRPLVILDGAHNPSGMSAFCRTLRTDFSVTRCVALFGVLDDKDYGAMLKILATVSRRIVLTTPPGVRAVHAQEITHIAARYCRDVIAMDDPIAAFRQLRSQLAADDCLCVTGSLYLVGEIKKFLTD